MRLRAIDQLFDPIDPSPYGQQDLSQWAAEYIVESINEMQAPESYELVLVLDAPAAPVPDLQVVASAVRAHFARQGVLRGRALRRLLRRGGLSLAIGIAFLLICFGISRTVVWMLGDSPVSTLLREGSLIVGWVAMWRPIEILLYDWWPILGEQRLFERLSRISVRIVSGSPIPSSHDEPMSDAARMATRALARWENEGGRVQQPTTADPPSSTSTPQPPLESRPAS